MAYSQMARYAVIASLMWFSSVFCAAQYTFYIPPVVAINLDTTVWQLPYTTPYYYSAKSFVPEKKVTLINRKNGLKISVYVEYYGHAGLESTDEWGSYMFCKDNTPINGMLPKQTHLLNRNNALVMSYVDTTMSNVVVYFDTNCPSYDAAMLKEVKDFIMKVKRVAPEVIDKAAGYPLNQTVLTDSIYATRPYIPLNSIMPEPTSWRLYHFLDYKFNFTYAAYHKAMVKEVMDVYTAYDWDCMTFGVYNGNEGQLLVDSFLFDNPNNYVNDRWSQYQRRNYLFDKTYRMIMPLSTTKQGAWNILYSDSTFALCYASRGEEGNLLQQNYPLSIMRWYKENLIYRRKHEELSARYSRGMNYHFINWLDNNKSLGAITVHTNKADERGVLEAAPVYYLFRADLDSMHIQKFSHEYESKFDFIVMADARVSSSDYFNSEPIKWFWKQGAKPYRIFSRSDDKATEGVEISVDAAERVEYTNALVMRAAAALPQTVLFCLPPFIYDLDNDGGNEVVSALVSNGQIVDYKISTITKDGFLNRNKSEEWQKLLNANENVAKWLANSKEGLSPFMQEALEVANMREQAKNGTLDLESEELYNKLKKYYKNNDDEPLQQMRIVQLALLNTWETYGELMFSLKMDSPNEWLKQNLKYPAKEKAAKHGCAVAIDFEATPDGSIVNIMTPQTNAKNGAFVTEAMRLLKLVGKLNPPSKKQLSENTAMQFIVHFIP